MLRDHIRLAPGDRREDEPIDAPAKKRRNDGLLPLGVVIEAGRKNRDPPGSQRIFYCPVDLAAEWVGDTRQQEPDGERSPARAAQAAGGHVQLVVELS